MQIIVDIREKIAPQSKDNSNLFSIKDDIVECFSGMIMKPLPYGRDNSFHSNFYDIRSPYQGGYKQYNDVVKQSFDLFFVNNIYLAIEEDIAKKLQLPQAYEEELFSCLNNNQYAINAVCNTLTDIRSSGFVITAMTPAFEKTILTSSFYDSIIHNEVPQKFISSHLEEFKVNCPDYSLHLEESILTDTATQDLRKILRIRSYLTNISAEAKIALTKYLFNSSFKEIL